MRKLWPILVLGIIIRIVLAFSTFHPDLQVFNLAGRIIASGNIFNLYDFSSNSAVLNYPPAIYLFHGIFNFLFYLLGLSGVDQLNFRLLLLKLPYLIPDLLTGFILMKLFASPKEKVLAFTLWMFHPINLYATYMMGQFDIIPTFFIVLSIYLVVKNKFGWAAVALGIGIAFKLFPLFLVIPLIIFGKNYREKLKLLILAITPYILSIIPYLPSHSFRVTALFATQNSKSIYANIPISGGESIILFPALLLLFYLIIWGLKVKMDIWKLYLIPLLLFFIFTHYHPQWFIWITPFLVFDLVISGYKNLLPNLLIFVSWFVSLFFFDPSLTVNIFAPILPGLKNLPNIWMLLHLNIDYNLSRSLVQTLLVSSMTFLIYENFKKRIDE